MGTERENLARIAAAMIDAVVIIEKSVDVNDRAISAGVTGTKPTDQSKEMPLSQKKNQNTIKNEMVNTRKREKIVAMNLRGMKWMSYGRLTSASRVKT